MELEHVIGLEVHVELLTKTKAYCSCKNEFGAMPNTNCCPVCMGFPGTLPALNREAVSHAIRAGLAFGCKINRISRQDRKNYFYPDLPKGYQITQYDIPLCSGGAVEIQTGGQTRRIRLSRIHIEEDAGKLIHDGAGTLLDFNRSGVPLIEIVTEPDLRSAEEAGIFLETLRQILIYLGVTDGKMQEGSIRCDVNVSVREEGSRDYGVRCEMKNVNTFHGAQRAIEYEIKRQEALIRSGGEVEPESRRWDDEAGKSFVMRTKENAADYRYFPEANVIPIVVEDKWIEEIRAQISELPREKKQRYTSDWGLCEYEAGLLVSSKPFAEYFEQTVSMGAEPKEASEWCLGALSKLLNAHKLPYDAIPVPPANLAKLIALIHQGAISESAAKKVLGQMFESGEEPEGLIVRMGLGQINEEKVLSQWVSEVIGENSKAVLDYRSGKKSAMGYLMGQVMKKSGGRANPSKASQILREALAQV